jgi:hypothetical protein
MIKKKSKNHLRALPLFDLRVCGAQELGSLLPYSAVATQGVVWDRDGRRKLLCTVRLGASQTVAASPDAPPEH